MRALRLRSKKHKKAPAKAGKCNLDKHRDLGIQVRVVYLSEHALLALRVRFLDEGII